MHADIQQLLRKLDISYSHPKLLKQAFTHSSYVNEHRTARRKDNERLEFLGDAVLELTISEYLFRQFPDKPEGELTRLRASIVCEPSLYRFAEELDFGRYILLGKGEELTGGRNRPALLADVFEAFIGSLYLDQGLEAVRHFLRRFIFPNLSGEGSLQVTDFKTKLQEYVQHHNLGSLDYRIVEERGPAHDREFIAEACIDNAARGRGAGRSKKEAEQQAAAAALQKIAEKAQT